MRLNKRLQQTALRAHKIEAILKAGISLTAFLIYRCAATEAQAVGPPSALCPHDAMLFVAQEAHTGSICLPTCGAFVVHFLHGTPIQEET